MTLTDIARLCNHVSNFARRQNWHILATPVICWEFSTLSEFHCAKLDLEKMINSQPYYAAMTSLQPRTISPATIEFDCYGLVFRLTCNQRLMTEHGEVGATQVKPTYFPLQPPFHDQ